MAINLLSQDKFSKKCVATLSRFAKEPPLSSACLNSIEYPAQEFFGMMSNIKPVIILAIINAKNKILDNKVEIYGSEIEKKPYASLVMEFSLLLKDNLFFKVPLKK